MSAACNLVWHFRSWMMPWITACHLTIWAKIAAMIFLTKITLPLIIAYSDGTNTERQFWQRTIGDGAFADGDFETACAILQRYDAIDRSVAEACTIRVPPIVRSPIAAQSSANPKLLSALSEAANLPRTARTSHAMAAHSRRLSRAAQEMRPFTSQCCTDCCHHLAY